MRKNVTLVKHPLLSSWKKSLNHSSRSLSVILYMYKTLSRHSDSLGYVVASFGSLRMCKGAQHPASNGDRDGVGREGRHSGPAKWELQETVAKEGGGGGEKGCVQEHTGECAGECTGALPKVGRGGEIKWGKGRLNWCIILCPEQLVSRLYQRIKPSYASPFFSGKWELVFLCHRKESCCTTASRQPTGPWSIWAECWELSDNFPKKTRNLLTFKYPGE